MQSVARPLAVALLAVAASAAAAPPEWQKFAGAWQITGSATAPWADPTHPPQSAESKRLAGKRVTFTPHRVAGPSPLGCLKPQYTVQVVPADGIFEGMLADPRNGQPTGSAAARASAKALGFDDPEHILSIDVGCSEVRFHWLHRGVLVFGLNNRVYTMVRKK
jgi:hypothetical protein